MEFGDSKQDQEERQKYFDYNLRNSPKQVRETYSRVLLDENLRLAKENGKPVKIPLERREELLDIAQKHSFEDARKIVKMDHDWDGATDKETGRPPIGGAPND